MNLINLSVCLLSSWIPVVGQYLFFPATPYELIEVKMNYEAAPRLDLWNRVLVKVLLFVKIWIERTYFHQRSCRGALQVVV